MASCRGPHTTVIAAGGGVRNDFLMRRLAEALAPARLTTTDEMGVPAQAKEALAFALLAWLSWHGLPGNVPNATGAKHPAVLGKCLYEVGLAGVPAAAAHGLPQRTCSHHPARWWLR